MSDSEINLCAISIIYCVAFTTFCTTVLVVMGIDSCRFRAALDMQHFFVAMTTEKTQFSRLILKCFLIQLSLLKALTFFAVDTDSNIFVYNVVTRAEWFLCPQLCRLRNEDFCGGCGDTTIFPRIAQIQGFSSIIMRCLSLQRRQYVCMR